MKGKVYLAGVVLGLIMFSSASYADDLSIYDVQYTTDPSGDSPYNLETHNVLGGIVTLTDGSLTAVPYFAWANRGSGQMRVWVPDS